MISHRCLPLKLYDRMREILFKAHSHAYEKQRHIHNRQNSVQVNGGMVDSDSPVSGKKKGKLTKVLVLKITFLITRVFGLHLNKREK